MTKKVQAILNHREQQAGTDRLLRHCLSLGAAEGRVPIRARLEALLGPELTHRLITSLTGSGRR